MDLKYDCLKKILARYDSMLVAFSGGVDSTFLLRAAVDEIGDYVIWDILIPAFKSTITDIVANSVEMLFYGEPRARGRDRDACVDAYVTVRVAVPHEVPESSRTSIA